MRRRRSGFCVRRSRHLVCSVLVGRPPRDRGPSAASTACVPLLTFSSPQQHCCRRGIAVPYRGRTSSNKLLSANARVFSQPPIFRRKPTLALIYHEAKKAIGPAQCVLQTVDQRIRVTRRVKVKTVLDAERPFTFLVSRIQKDCDRQL